MRKALRGLMLLFAVLAILSCGGSDNNGANGEPGSDRFQNNGNGTLTDLTTGLVWQRADSGTPQAWVNAKAYCENLTLGGQNDWQLPDKNQVLNLVDDRYLPTIEPVFQGTKALHYWSSTENKDCCAWSVSFLDGRVSNGFFRTDAFYARCVRDPG